MQECGRIASLLDYGRSAEMVDMVMRADQEIKVFDSDPDLIQCILQRSDTVGGVHPSVYQRPRTMTVYQVDIDNRGPHRQWQENFVNPWMNFAYFCWHDKRLSRPVWSVIAAYSASAAQAMNAVPSSL
jgi:hypothetical protein